MGKFTQRSTAPQLSGCRWGVVVFQHRNAFKLNTYKILFPQFASCTFLCSVTQSCPTFQSPHGHSTPGCPVLHHLPELAQTHVIKLVMPSIHLCHPFLLLPSVFPSIRIFVNESALHTGRPKIWSLSLSPCSE